MKWKKMIQMYMNLLTTIESWVISSLSSIFICCIMQNCQDSEHREKCKGHIQQFSSRSPPLFCMSPPYRLLDMNGIHLSFTTINSVKTVFIHALGHLNLKFPFQSVIPRRSFLFSLTFLIYIPTPSWDISSPEHFYYLCKVHV